MTIVLNLFFHHYVNAYIEHLTIVADNINRNGIVHVTFKTK